ncbi:hypothetical protein [Clostridium butyricum]|uniref:hypothetical protein n=1 Tax=Clostridium butyricum TaxID=1492 RepID=UPI00374E6787
MNEKEIKYTSPKENLIDVKFEREEPYGENIEPTQPVKFNLKELFNKFNGVLIGTESNSKPMRKKKEADIGKKIIDPETSEGIDVVIIDPESEYEELAKMLGGKVIHLTSNSGYFNPLELSETNTTNKDIIKHMGIIIECKKALNEDIEINEILNEICIKNNLELSDSDRNEILKIIEHI